MRTIHRVGGQRFPSDYRKVANSRALRPRLRADEALVGLPRDELVGAVRVVAGRDRREEECVVDRRDENLQLDELSVSAVQKTGPVHREAAAKTGARSDREWERVGGVGVEEAVLEPAIRPEDGEIGVALDVGRGQADDLVASRDRPAQDRRVVQDCDIS